MVATDAFASRPAISLASYGTSSATIDTTAATRQTGEPLVGANSGETASVWVGLSPVSVTGVVRVAVVDSGFDSLLAVYKNGANTFAGLALQASNDDCALGSSPAAGTEGSCVKVRVVAGSSYAIQVTGFGAGVGTARLSLTFSAK